MERTSFGLLFYIRRNKLYKSLTLASGATIENVAKMLGHVDTKMTRHMPGFSIPPSYGTCRS